MKKYIVPMFLLITLAGAPSSRADNDTLPHGEAIILVLTTQAALIKKADADKDGWWHDTKVRGFRVLRPFGPGTIDSTHLFTVIYAIDKKAVQCWWVDTRHKTVKAMECP